MPSPRMRAMCSSWAKCLGRPGDCDQARRRCIWVIRLPESISLREAEHMAHEVLGAYDFDRYCGLTPAASTSSAFASISLSTNLANSLDVIGIGSTPNAASFSAVLGDL